MPHLDKTGPKSEDSKAGRKLGLCNKNESDKEGIGELGKGQGKRRHSGGGEGRAKRLKYNNK